eukprot:scaffold680_cov264-Pinguiococcus_pyrenoidosus.AAC.20
MRPSSSCASSPSARCAVEAMGPNGDLASILEKTNLPWTSLSPSCSRLRRLAPVRTSWRRLT